MNTILCDDYIELECCLKSNRDRLEFIDVVIRSVAKDFRASNPDKLVNYLRYDAKLVRYDHPSDPDEWLQVMVELEIPECDSGHKIKVLYPVAQAIDHVRSKYPELFD